MASTLAIVPWPFNPIREAPKFTPGISVAN
jgi:hypothetical protein